MVQIDTARFDVIKTESDRTGKAMNVISDELISIGIAVKRGEVIEQQSLPVIREIVTSELRKGFATQHETIREDMQLEFTNEIKAITRASNNRLAALIVLALRDANIGRRFLPLVERAMSVFLPPFTAFSSTPPSGATALQEAFPPRSLEGTHA